MKKIFCIALSAFCVWGCHSKPASSNTDRTTAVDTVKHQTVNAKPIEKGLTDSVFCTSDPKQIYAVYLPAKYDPAKKWPIIYFFDPHGAGNFPLTLYKKLADKYGYILAGTYGSKNGMQGSETEKAAQAFMQDTWQRLSIDNNRIYTFGFSGGARVACSVALDEGGITGVVACGGGFPEKNPEIHQPFTFMGFVGDRDFNYTELKQLDRELNNSPLQHQLIIYHGKHQWPPQDVAEQAFQWFEASAMKMHFIPKNDSLVKAILQHFLNEAEKAKTQNKSVEEYLAYKKIQNYLGDIADVIKYSDIANALEKSDKVQKYLEDEQTDEQQEMRTQQAFIDYLSNKELSWWTGTIRQLREFIKKDTLSPVALQNQRLLSYLSLASYMGASQALKSENDNAAAHFLEVYNLVDPTNPEHCYLYACIDARENNLNKALSNLADAVKLGFNDIGRMQRDSNFVALRDMPAFKELVKKIKAMPPKVDMAL